MVAKTDGFMVEFFSKRHGWISGNRFYREYAQALTEKSRLKQEGKRAKIIKSYDYI